MLEGGPKSRKAKVNAIVGREVAKIVKENRGDKTKGGLAG